MGFFRRLVNLLKGFLGLSISDLESRNPQAVYEAAINERIRRHKELKKAVASILYLRNKLSDELQSKEKELAEIQPQIPVAVDEGVDDVALVLIEKKDSLLGEIADVKVELERVVSNAEEAKEGLIQFKGEIEKLKHEKDEMLAKKATADARIRIQETLDGLSTDADIRALDNVRENINKAAAEVDVNTEINDNSLDKKLAEIKEKTADASAKAQLDELKKARQAQKAGASESAGVNKTM